ncbi:hypothetical protein AMELA_G00258440, partial [Ameiurus melas]
RSHRKSSGLPIVLLLAAQNWLNTLWLWCELHFRTDSESEDEPRACSKDLKDLLKFWVGWEVAKESLAVEVVFSGDLPRASTCFCILRLPGHYKDYQSFRMDLIMCIGSALGHASIVLGMCNFTFDYSAAVTAYF